MTIIQVIVMSLGLSVYHQESPSTQSSWYSKILARQKKYLLSKNVNTNKQQYILSELYFFFCILNKYESFNFYVFKKKKKYF